MFKIIYIFLIYAFLGWFMEVTIVSIQKKKLTARGFLIGPWCPIYGFGALGLILVYFLNPFFLRIIQNIPPIIFNIIIIIITIIFITDVIISYIIISNFKKEGISDTKDITEKANEKIKQVLKDKSLFNRRLINAFPHLKFITKK